MRKLHPTVASLPLLAIAACSLCGKQPPARLDLSELARRLPGQAKITLLIPKLGSFGEKLKRLEQLKAASLAAQLQGFDSSSEYVTAITNQIGMDFRSSSEIARTGIDPDQGFGVAVVPNGSVAIVVAVKDPAKLREAVANYARDHWGTVVATSSQKGGVSWTRLSSKPGITPQISYSIRDGVASIVLDVQASAPAPLEPAGARDRLSEDPFWSATVKELPDGDLYLRLPSGWQLGRWLSVPNSTVAVDLTPKAVKFRGRISSTSETSLALEKQPAEVLSGALPDDAFLLARFVGKPLRLGSVLKAIWGSSLEDAFRDSGVDLRSDVLGNLKPGVIASLSLAPTAILSSAPVLDVRRTNPFRFVHLVAIGSVKNVEQAKIALGRIGALAPKLGATVLEKQVAGRKVFVTSYAQGEGADFALIDDKLLVAAPMKRLEEALNRLSEPSDLRKAFAARSDLGSHLERGTLDAVVDVPRFCESIKNLPGSAWGVGGFAVKAAMLRWLTALDDLRALTLSLDAGRTFGVIDVELDVLLAEP